ncbi:hypothetical protein DFH27DRAFT_220310 [Peziza echinospora]|nr:hypothetical protein DFH27DRAFT_220310 [Peziza echinospora]
MAHAFPPEPLPEEDWDVLILGTGLKQSLLACALSRASKKVLQLDPSDNYGSSEASFSNLYAEVDRWVEAINNPTEGIRAPFSHARVWRDEARLLKGGGQWTVTLSPQVIYWENKLLGVLREVEMTGQFVWQAVGGWWVYNDGVEDVEDDNISGGGGVMGMVQSVGMKAAKAGLKAKGWNKGRRKAAASSSDEPAAAPSGSSITTETPTLPDIPKLQSSTPSTLRTIPPEIPANVKTAHLKETPCTFEDIAWDPTLTDHYRTILASFLRHVLQPNTNNTEVSEESSPSLHTLLTTTFPLPSHVRQSIHALTLIPTPINLTPASLAISRLRTHFLSLGRIPDIRSAAALFTQYGCASEMCQVFCRGAAVAGGICVLGRGITSITNGSSPTTPPTVVLSTGETISPRYIVTSQWDTFPSSQPTITPPPPSSIPNTRRFKRAIYAISSPFSPLFRAKYADERINPGGAVIVYYPPHTSKSGPPPNPVHILARAAANGECPQGYTLFYVSQLNPGAEDEEIDSEYTSLDSAVAAVLAPFREAKVENGDDEPSVEVIFKLFYTQRHHLSPSSPAQKDAGGAGIFTLADIPLDFILDGQQSEGGNGAEGTDVVEDVLRVYGKIMMSGRGGDGVEVAPGALTESEVREGFMQVSEETRRLMRENE